MIYYGLKVAKYFFKKIIMTDIISSYHPLKVKVVDQEDLNIFSLAMQDSLCPFESIIFEKDTFTFLANRFCWELEKDADPTLGETYHRVHCGICVMNVSKVLHNGVDNFGIDEQKILNLLTVRFETKGTQNFLRLIFSNDFEMQIYVSNLDIYTNDFHHPWPTKNRPMHLHEHMQEMQLS
jgi:hypothetical protein